MKKWLFEVTHWYVMQLAIHPWRFHSHDHLQTTLGTPTRFSRSVPISDTTSYSDRPHHPRRHRFCHRCKPQHTMSIDSGLSPYPDSVFNLFLCLLFNDESRWTNLPVKALLKFTTLAGWTRVLWQLDLGTDGLRANEVKIDV